MTKSLSSGPWLLTQVFPTTPELYRNSTLRLGLDDRCCVHQDTKLAPWSPAWVSSLSSLLRRRLLTDALRSRCQRHSIVTLSRHRHQGRWHQPSSSHPVLPCHAPL